MTEYELIDMLRIRTALFTGVASPTHLRSFMDGYFTATKRENPDKEEPKFHGFHDWVAKKFDYSESTSGWANMIEDQREDKKEALDLFYELLDEYRGIKHKQIGRVEFKHEDKIDRSWRGYSRLKKVRGTFEEVHKPSPKEILIRKMNIVGDWFQMVAINEKEEILFTWGSDEIEKVYKRANEIFGIEKHEWKTKENGS